MVGDRVSCLAPLRNVWLRRRDKFQAKCSELEHKCFKRGMQCVVGKWGKRKLKASVHHCAMG